MSTVEDTIGDSKLPNEFRNQYEDNNNENLPGGFHGEDGEEQSGENLPGGFHGEDGEGESSEGESGGQSGEGESGGESGEGESGGESGEGESGGESGGDNKPVGPPSPGYDPDNIFSDPAFLSPEASKKEFENAKELNEYVTNVFVGGKIQSIIAQASEAFQKTQETINVEKRLDKYYKSDLYKYIKNSDVTALKQDLNIARKNEDEIEEKQGIPKLSSGRPKYYSQSPTLKGAETSLGFSSKVEEQALLSAGVMNRLDSNYYTSFSRFGFVDPYTANTNSREYIFITKPDLHLFNSGTPNPELMNNSSFFHDNLVRYKEVAHQLQYTFWEGSFGPFMQILSNAYDGQGVEVPGVMAELEDTSTNVYGINIKYRGTSYESDLNTEVSLSFKDSKHLEVYMLFKMYDEYEKLKWKGLVTPTRINYVYRKILHDMMTMYKFVVGEDGITLRYWARYTGGCPISTSREIFSTYPEGEITLNTTWRFNFFSDMDPVILSDFNRLTTNGRNRCKKDASGFPQPLPIAYGNGDNETEWPFTAGIYSNKADDRNSRMNKYYLLWFGRR